MEQTDLAPTGESTSADAAQIDRQAERLERVMPNILRRLFALHHDNTLADMPLAQLRICSYLQDGPRSMSAIAEELGMSTSAVTQIADRMERSALVERAPDHGDRRQKHLHLTPHGARLMHTRTTRRTERARQALSRLSPDERTALLNSLEQLLEATIETAPPLESITADPLQTVKTAM